MSPAAGQSTQASTDLRRFGPISQLTLNRASGQGYAQFLNKCAVSCVNVSTAFLRLRTQRVPHHGLRRRDPCQSSTPSLGYSRRLPTARRDHGQGGAAMTVPDRTVVAVWAV